MTLEATVGSLLRRFRQQRSMTQEQVAPAAGCSTAYIGLIEHGARGRKLSRDLSLRLARALDMPPAAVDDFLKAGGHLAQHESIFDPQELDVVTEIVRDSALSYANKGLLISVYAELSGTGRLDRGCRSRRTIPSWQTSG